MKIIIDKYIPFLKGIFEPFADVEYLSSEDIVKDRITEASCIVVRTRTLCDEALLSGSGIKMVASATAGYEHIDLDYCSKAGINVFVARGCNATSVSQYIGSALVACANHSGESLCGKTIGIVGYGFVGKATERIARLMGMRVLLNDPPLEEFGNDFDLVSLEKIAEESDFITFHTPLTNGGKYPTHYLASTDFFSLCRKKPFILNASRGGVVDEAAMLMALDKGEIAGFAIDCWENEPNINTEVLEKSVIATPHIAGYSADSKANGSKMCVEAICDFFGFQLSEEFQPLEPKKSLVVEVVEVAKTIIESYDILSDSYRLKMEPCMFEYQRNNYRKDRREVEIILK